MQDRVSVVILGGGCAGWWTAKELSQRRLPCMVIDTFPFASRASTRNQGWLHTGAFYLSVDQPDHQVAQNCLAGYNVICRQYPSAVRSEVPCYFLFERAEERDESFRLCRDSHIFARRISLDSSDLELREPIIAGTPLRFALEVHDHPVDTTRILRSLSRLCCASGVRVYTASAMESICPVWLGDHWRIECDHTPIVECEAIVLACGAYIPDMLGKVLSRGAPAFRRTKIGVLALKGAVASSILATPRTFSGPNLVPFADASAVGATVTLMRTDTPIVVSADYAVSSRSLESYAANLSDLYCGVTTVVGERRTSDTAIMANFYVCQKLDLPVVGRGEKSNRHRILQSFAPQVGASASVIAFYPGKFTTAPLAAAECADLVQGIVGKPPQSLPGAQSRPPAIAKQPHYEAPTIRASVERGVLRFDDLRKD